MAPGELCRGVDGTRWVVWWVYGTGWVLRVGDGTRRFLRVGRWYQVGFESEYVDGTYQVGFVGR